MSEETAEWLNTQTLIGFTDKRGEAWHYQESLQGDEPNHYTGAIPVEDVERRLFNWEAVAIPHTYTYNGVTYTSNRQDIIRSDMPEVLMGVFTDGYQGHQYRQWLLNNVSSILDGELAIGSAGLLKEGAQAWVSVEVPENVKTPEGVTFRPNLLAATSFDGSIATTYGCCVQIVVCDNTLRAGLNEKDQQFKLKHTRYSTLEGKLANAREALKIVYDTADDFAAEVKRLCATTVSTDVWNKVTETMVLKDKDGNLKTGRSLTAAEKKRAKLNAMYATDIRVAQWNGTAFGVLQAFNTWEHHEAGVRGQSITQRNRAAALTGTINKKDEDVLALVDSLVAA